MKLITIIVLSVSAQFLELRKVEPTNTRNQRLRQELKQMRSDITKKNNKAHLQSLDLFRKSVAKKARRVNRFKTEDVLTLTDTELKVIKKKKRKKKKRRSVKKEVEMKRA